MNAAAERILHHTRAVNKNMQNKLVFLHLETLGELIYDFARKGDYLSLTPRQLSISKRNMHEL